MERYPFGRQAKGYLFKIFIYDGSKKTKNPYYYGSAMPGKRIYCPGGYAVGARNAGDQGLPELAARRSGLPGTGMPW
jgi:hypothetical protein